MLQDLSLISMQNYTKIRPKKKLLNILGPFDYEIFVGQLEEDRHISNALLFGNRVSFFHLKISIFHY